MHVIALNCIDSNRINFEGRLEALYQLNSNESINDLALLTIK